MLIRCSVILLSLLLNACTTSQKLTVADLNDKIRNSIVIVMPINKPATLAERTKGQALAKFVVATAVSSIAASGNINTKPGDIAAFREAANAQMEMGNMLNQQLQHSLPDHYKVASGSGADLALALKISTHYQSKLDPKANNQLYVNISAPVWELGYVSFLSSQNYALNYNFSISMHEITDGKDTVIQATNCSGKSEKEIALESWQANNYSEVDKESEKIINKCYEQFLSYMG